MYAAATNFQGTVPFLDKQFSVTISLQNKQQTYWYSYEAFSDKLYVFIGVWLL